MDFDGTFAYSPEVEVVIGLAETYQIEPAYPNPFNPQTQMRFAVQTSQHVTVSMFNALGRRIAVFYDGEAPSGEMQHVTIDGASLSSGVYLLQVQGERFTATQAVSLVK